MIPNRHIVRAACVSACLFFAPPSGRSGDGGAAAVAKSRPGGQEGPSSGRMWPVDVPVHLSSSFGEFRAGHLHAGVDIRSFGREGVPCRAVGSGRVSRLRASPEGYGKAVYLELDSGETVVYAHLSEFAAEIDAYVAARQLESGRYRADLYPAPGDLEVRAGEIIGFTGRTGAAAPHLHFEVRDEMERPVNPLDAGWALPDRVPPTIRRIQCLPLSPAARVNGRFAPAVVELRSLDDRTFAAKDTLRVTGRVGFAAQVIDRVGDASGNLAPYRVELEVDGVRVSALEMKRFAYEQTPEVELVYDVARARARNQHYLMLFRRRGETLAHREFVADGVVDAGAYAAGAGNAGGVHRVVVRAEDRAGNISTGSWAFVVSPAGAREADDPPRVGAPGAGGELPGFYFFEDMVSVRPLGREGGSPAGTARGGSAEGGDEEETVLTFDALGGEERSMRYRSAEGLEEVRLFGARRGEPLRRDFAALGVGLGVGGESLYATSLLYVAAWDRNAGETLVAGSGLRALTPGVRLGPMSAAFRAPVEIRFFAPEAPAGRAGVFRFDERRGSWSFRTSSARGDTVSAAVREPGVYAVLADTIAPAIGPSRIVSRRSFATGSLVRDLVIPLTDGGSGVDPDRTEVYLDGRKQIARWDGFLEKMIVILRDENIIGVRDLSIVAVDRLGNSTRLVTRLQVPPPAKQGGTGGLR